jgi:hypothetical protein
MEAANCTVIFLLWTNKGCNLLTLICECAVSAVISEGFLLLLDFFIKHVCVDVEWIMPLMEPYHPGFQMLLNMSV